MSMTSSPTGAPTNTASASAQGAAPANQAAPLLPRRKLTFHPLRVAEINPLTADAVEVVFAVPDELAGEFDYRSGQHVAVRIQRDGAEVRRSYSLCAPPGGGTLHIAVKVEQGGIFSTYATSELKVDDVVEVMTPQGSFTVHPEQTSRAHIGAIAAGSGITPIMALARTVLGEAPDTTFTLVYSSRSANDVMFLDQLADLKDRYPARLAVHHVLTRQQQLAPVKSGRLTAERLNELFDRLVPAETVDEWFLCGPIDLVTEARRNLQERGAEPARVHVELFSTGALRRTVRPAAKPARTGSIDDLRLGEAAVTMTLGGSTSAVVCGNDERILDAALRLRPDAPFACTSGICGTCRAKLIDGTVEMDADYALEPDELAAGYILTCQSVCTSAKVTINYDA